MARQGRVLVEQLFGSSPPVTHDDDVVDRFGRVRAFAGAVDTKAIAAEAELGDMAPAIGEKLAYPNRAGDDLIPAIGAVALGIDLVVTREADACADMLQCNQRIELTRLR